MRKVIAEIVAATAVAGFFLAVMVAAGTLVRAADYMPGALSAGCMIAAFTLLAGAIAALPAIAYLIHVTDERGRA